MIHTVSKFPSPRRGLRHAAFVSATFLIAVFIPDTGRCADWPMWHLDPARSCSSDEELPETLHLQWILELPTPRPAWPAAQEKLQFDRLYEPILLGEILVLPSMLDDSVSAYEIEDGRKLWSFRADGPVRFAPAGWGGKVYFVSDDGYLYSLDAATGRLRWKFRGGPSERKVLGQDRLIGMWPARGAPVVFDGTVYFAAGIWPFMGIFIHALDAETGNVVWTQSGTGSRWTVQQHDSPAFGGVAPQGYLAATEDHLVVAGGRTVPAVFDRRTGRLIHFEVASRDMDSKGGGGYEVLVGDGFYLNRGLLYRLEDGKYVGPAGATVLAGDTLLGSKDGDFRGIAAGIREEEVTDRRGRRQRRLAVETRWKTDLEPRIERIIIRSGSRAYAAGEGNAILAVDLPKEGEKARISWRSILPDEPLDMISGAGRLFVSTSLGRVYCFGGLPRPGVEVPLPELTDLVPMGSRWRYLDGGKDPAEGWEGPAFDDSTWPEGPAQLGYGDGDEATKLDFGGNKEKKAIAYYFRHAFQAPSKYERLEVELLVDDGAVAYLNGNEIARIFMPDGAVGPATKATTTAEEGETVRGILPADVLRRGENVLAVEVHQVNGSSSDLSFDLGLRALERPTEPSVRTAPVGGGGIWGEILDACGAESGYGLVLGASGLPEQIALASRLHVVVLEPDPERVGALRQRLDDLGLYGSRVAVLPGTILHAGLPPYMAELVVAGSPIPEDAAEAAAFVKEVFRVLRPHTGAACFLLEEGEHEKLGLACQAASLDGGAIERRGGLTVIRRLRAPTGAGRWTHQYADASNSVASKDTLVRAPLGLLWFGGPSNEGILPRHGHGPTPQVVDGRIIIEGRDLLRAIDLYTGRFLWERRLKDLGKFYDYTSHEPGANALGSNYVSLEDGIFVAHGRRLLTLDPKTGETVREVEAPQGPEDPRGDRAIEWGYIGASGDFLVAGLDLSSFAETDFTAEEIASLKEDDVDGILAGLSSWKGFELDARQEGEKDKDYLLRNLNKLLGDPDMIDGIPKEARRKAGVDDLAKQIEAFLEETGPGGLQDLSVRIGQRLILARGYGLPSPQVSAPGTTKSFLRTASKRLVCMERATGRILWETGARNAFRHNAIAMGNGKVFCIDRLPERQWAFYKRRGYQAEEDAALLALDLRSGEKLWSASSGVFGTWLGYSEEFDVLLEGGSSSRDRLVDEVGKGMTAYRGSTGDVIWRSDLSYGGPPMIVGTRIVTQVQGKGGFALDLDTGEEVLRTHPISEEGVPWRYSRNYGCNTAVASSHILTFRSAAAGYYDLRGDGGTGNFGGFRSGCTSNLIPAGGVLCAPDYTRTCTCAYQNQVSLAFVHMPDAEIWTFQTLPRAKGAVRRLGLNFGAPGDRLGPDGTLWLDSPSRGGPSPDLDVKLDLEPLESLTFHSSHIVEGEIPWVTSSAVLGTGEIAIPLLPEEQDEEPKGEAPARPQAYTVRLFFAEIEDLEAGQRVFDVSLQGEVRLAGFDIRRESGASRRTLLRELRDIAPRDGALRIGLRAVSGRPPLLCGVQVLARDEP